MATDYRFAIRCWQDKELSENAKINVYVNDNQILTEAEVSAESQGSANIISFEATGLADPTSGVSQSIKVQLANEYYVDADTDRNVHIDWIGYLNKDSDNSYKLTNDQSAGTNSTITDFTTIDNFRNCTIPSAVTGDQVPDDWNESSDAFFTVTVWGGDSGVTFTLPTPGYSFVRASERA